ncbi:MAG TPA: hypothetical protein VM582_01780, partial [Candidatus Thermoplasmatota archaeon]|nr:hypothetical protein [Candidatus Thermoplasmatota archaeon]
LGVAVVRPGPSAPIPVAGARVVVRPYPRHAARPEDPVARGATGPDGTFSASLPPGRYAVYAQHEGEGRAVTVSLAHAGRARLSRTSVARRATLTVEVNGLDGEPLPDAAVDVRAHPSGAHAARIVTNDDGVAHVALPPGAYELHVGGAATRTYLEADTVVRVTAEPHPLEGAAPPPLSRYAQRARAATATVAPLDGGAIREEVWN